MNHKIIRDLINTYFVKAGEVVSFSSYSIVTDEDTRLKALLAHYLFEEARKIHRDADSKIDSIIDDFINCYGLNGVRNDIPQNKMIWSIIDSNGHVEEKYLDDGFIGNKYQIFMGPNRDFGITILRYLARQNGFDIENFQIAVDKSELPSKGVSKISIDFTKGPVLKERPKEKKEVVRDKGKKKVPRTTAQEQLDLARQRNDTTMIKYWEDILAGKNPTFQREIDPPYIKKGIFDDTKRKLETARDRVQKYIAEVMAKRSSGEPIKEKSARPEKEIIQKEESIGYIKEQIEEARRAGDEEKFKYWKSILSLVDGKEPAKESFKKEEKQEPRVVQQESAPELEPEEDKLEYAKAQLQRAIDENNQAEIEFWTTMIKFDTPKESERKHEESEDISYIENQLRRAQESGDEAGADYWKKLLDQLSGPKATKQATSTLDETKLAYVKAQLDLAKRAHDEVMVQYWESTLMSMQLEDSEKKKSM